MSYARKTPLRLLPHLAEHARKASKSYGLPLSTYFGVLLWNFAMTPRRMSQEEEGRRTLARISVPCSIRPAVWSVAAEAIAQSGLSTNALIEALVAEEKRAARTQLCIKALTNPKS